MFRFSSAFPVQSQKPFQGVRPFPPGFPFLAWNLRVVCNRTVQGDNLPLVRQGETSQALQLLPGTPVPCPRSCGSLSHDRDFEASPEERHGGPFPFPRDRGTHPTRLHESRGAFPAEGGRPSHKSDCKKKIPEVAKLRSEPYTIANVFIHRQAPSSPVNLESGSWPIVLDSCFPLLRYNFVSPLPLRRFGQWEIESLAYCSKLYR